MNKSRHMLAKNLLLRNWSSMQIVANILVLFFSLFYVESSTLFATLFVTLSFITINIISIQKSIKVRTFSFHPYLFDKKITESIIAFSIIIVCGIRSFIFIKALSGLQYVGMNSSHEIIQALQENIISVIIIGIFSVLFFSDSLMRVFESLNFVSYSEQIEDLILKYKIDVNNTYFFSIKGSIVAFIIGDYKFDLDTGLMIGKRKYRMLLLLDYMNISGIGFSDLNDGHIKNIEMYGVNES